MLHKICMAMLLLNLLFIQSTSGQGTSTSKVVTGKSVKIISMPTISGDVIDVTVPDEIRPGDNFAATVVSQKSSATLDGAVVDVQNNKIGLAQKIVKIVVPAAGAAIPFLLRDSKGKAIAQTTIPVTSEVTPHNFTTVTTPGTTLPRPPVNGTFTVPSFAVPGELLTIRGVFDGNPDNTHIKINNVACNVATEWPRGVSVTVPNDNTIPLGQNTVRIEEAGIVKTAPIYATAISMSTNEPNIIKGQLATVNVMVNGLNSGVMANNGYHLSVNNMSPNCISFAGNSGTTMNVAMDPKLCTNNSFSFSTDIRGVTSGRYTMNSVLSSDYDNYAMNCADQYQSALDAGMSPELAGRFHDFVLAAYHPGTGEGSCSALPPRSGSITCAGTCTTGTCIVFSIPKASPLPPGTEPAEEGASATVNPAKIYFCSCSTWWFW